MRLRHIIAALALAGAVYAANELALQCVVQYTKNGAQVQATRNVQVTVSGNVYGDQIYDVDTNETRVSLAVGLTAPGCVFMQNLNPTNVVLWGTTTGDLGAKIGSNEWVVFRMASTNLYLQASTNTVLVRVLMFSE